MYSLRIVCHDKSDDEILVYSDDSRLINNFSRIVHNHLEAVSRNESYDGKLIIVEVIGRHGEKLSVKGFIQANVVDKFYVKDGTYVKVEKFSEELESKKFNLTLKIAKLIHKESEPEVAETIKADRINLKILELMEEGWSLYVDRYLKPKSAKRSYDKNKELYFCKEYLNRIVNHQKELKRISKKDSKYLSVVKSYSAFITWLHIYIKNIHRCAPIKAYYSRTTVLIEDVDDKTLRKLIRKFKKDLHGRFE